MKVSLRKPRCTEASVYAVLLTAEQRVVLKKRQWGLPVFFGNHYLVGYLPRIQQESRRNDKRMTGKHREPLGENGSKLLLLLHLLQINEGNGGFRWLLSALDQD